MHKVLLKNVDEFNSLKFSQQNLDHGNRSPIVVWHVGEPEQYPCVCLYRVFDNPNGPYEVEGEYVYLSDFVG